jgi:glycosyltransferase involved in cell wall biosynthesis
MGGRAPPRNRGIQEAKGDWLAFLDTDDFWLPQKIEWQFRALERFKRNCGLCFTDAWFTNNHCMKMTLFELAGKRHDEPMGLISDPLGYMLATNSVVGVHPVWLQGLVTRTDLARRVGFDPDLRFGDDDDFVFRLGCETQFCFVSMPMVLIDRTPPVVRHHGVSADWDNSDFRLRMAQRRYEKRLQMIDRLPKAIHNSIRQNLSAVHSGWANWFLQARNYRAARKAMTEAAKLHLTPNTAVKWALTRVSPNITRKLALVRERKRRHGAAGIA